MSLIGVTGNVYETLEKASFEWDIPDFFSMTGNVDSYWQSPLFYHADSCLSLRIYPNGSKSNPEWVGLCLTREDSSPPKKVTVSFGIRSARRDYKSESPIVIRIVKGEALGNLKFSLITDLTNDMTSQTPNLMVYCSLGSKGQRCVEGSLFCRLWNLSRNLKTMLEKGNGADFDIKVRDRKLRVHKAILESRCDYFAGMFGSDFQENSTGTGDIDDIEEGVFQCILSYLYTGDTEGLSDGIVGGVYVAADKLLLEELKNLCSEYMEHHLSMDLICDAIAIAERYEEKNLAERALDYFAMHADDIFKSDRWRKLKEEHAELVSGILEKIVVRKNKRIRLGT